MKPSTQVKKLSIFSGKQDVQLEDSPSVGPTPTAKQKTFSSRNLRSSIFGKKKTDEEKEVKKQKKKKQSKGDDLDMALEDDQQKEPKYDREIVDFYQHDKDDRNILHRACLDQQLKLIEDIIQEFKTVLVNKDNKNKGNKNIEEELKKYVTQPDKFQCTPLILACVTNLTLANSTQQSHRFECIRFLVEENGADVNTFNPRTIWSPLNWCCHYGDYESVKFLLSKGAISYYPDSKGLYPIDLAGQCKNNGIVDLLFKQLIGLLTEYEEYKSGNMVIGNDRLAKFKSIDKDDKFLRTPLLRSKLLYWACYCKLDRNNIKKVIILPRCYILSPLQVISINMKKCLVYCTIEALHCMSQHNKYLLNSSQPWYYKEEVQKLRQSTFKPKPMFNNVFQFSPQELKKYKDEFIEEVVNFANWEQNHIEYMVQFSTMKIAQQQQSLIKNSKKPIQRLPAIDRNTNINIWLGYIDQQDLFGNTPLHIASLKGHPQIVQALLTFGANMEKENKELFKARELTQHQEILKVYQDEIKKMNQMQILNTLNEYTIQSLKMIVNQNKEPGQYFKIVQLSSKVSDQAYVDLLKDTFEYANDLFVPDFVIKIKLSSSEIESPDQMPQFFDLKNRESPELQRLNFQMSLLQNAKFDIYLMKSYFEQGYYYIMLKHQEDNLETQAQLMGLQVKLMDSYDLEPFQKKDQALFEPFRSRQRQEIIEAHLRRIMNLNELIQNKIASCFYRMHTFGGIQKIRHQWIEKTAWYWPQPINQMDDYLREGSNQNFTSITVLRLYFGEKISFFFAWKSYLTCALILLAIPGAAIQIYILNSRDYFPNILPYWVFYVCVWSTLQVEFWKRKTSEINTRWGSLDLLQDDTVLNQKIRDGFSGDEEINEITGEVTKHQKTAETIVKLLISVPILSFFIGCCVGIFVGVDYLIVNYAEDNLILQLILNIVQGVGITVLNLIYTKIAAWFAYIENHKFQTQYESSMIYKNAAFKFLNSYLAIIYAAFYKNTSTLQSLFALLLPVLIVKQANYMFLEVFIPQFIYKRKENQYFKKQQEIIFRQRQTKIHQYVSEDSKSEKPYFDIIERFWMFVFGNVLQSSNRAILKIEAEAQKQFTIDAGTPRSPFQQQHHHHHHHHPSHHKIKLETKIDADAVELNSLKLDFEGTLNYFMEGMIDMGYITLFAAAFPIGPMIALLANLVEIKMKMFSFLYVYKRPPCERCSGIGEWMNIMEIMSIVSVFSNFALLFVKQKEQTIKYLYGYQNEGQSAVENEDWAIWLFILSIVILLGLKGFFQWIIPDIPEWVRKEMERMGHKSASRSGSQESLRQAQEELLKVQANVEKAMRIYKNLRVSVKAQLEIKEDNIQKLSEEIDRQIEINENEKQMILKKDQLLKNIGVYSCKMKSDYSAIQLALIRSRYIQIEHMLLIIRLDQIAKSATELIFICQDCGAQEGLYECQECDESFCDECYSSVHAQINAVHKVLLLKEISHYNTDKLKFMNIQRRENQKQKFKIKYSKENIDVSNEIRRWKKFEEFCLPIKQQTEYFQYLEKCFQVLRDEYMIQTGMEVKESNNEFKMSKIFRYDNRLEDKSGFCTIESRNIQKLILMTELNNEDKLWLNRLAFLVFKRLGVSASFDDFYKLCRILQDGMLEQKILLLLDIIDQNDDGEISRSEFEKMFSGSFVQDTDGKEKLGDKINQLFSQKQKQVYSKKELGQLIMHSLNDDDFKLFIEALLQEKHH